MVNLYSVLQNYDTLFPHDNASDAFFRLMINHESNGNSLLSNALGDIKGEYASTTPIETTLDSLLELRKKEGKWWNLKAVASETRGLMRDLGKLVGEIHFLLYANRDFKNASFVFLWHAFFEDTDEQTLKERSQYLDGWLERLYSKQQGPVLTP
jgi:hypothetical protein